MAETFICDVYSTNFSNGKLGSNQPTLIQVHRNTKPVTVINLCIQNGHIRVTLQEGDLLTCLQGSAYVHVNPGTRATGFHLKKPPVYDEIHFDQVVLTKEFMTSANRHIQRGEIYAKPDIGNILRSTGAVTR